MGSLSNYAENKLLNHTLLGTSFTVPSNIYIALSTANPGEDGSTIAEPSGNAYARVAANSWATAASRATSNSGAITFPQATGSWGTITHIAIFDASTGGNMLAYDDLATSRAVPSGYTFSIASGDIDVSFNTGAVTNYLANKWLDHMFKVASYTAPTVTYVGLSTSNPTDTGSTTGEPSTGGYARQQETGWGVTGNAAANASTLTFTASGGSFGTVTHGFVADASSAGNMLFYGSLGTSGAINDGESGVYAAGDLDITLD